jgi:nucleoside-diphosphate-sugar epimerase
MVIGNGMIATRFAAYAAEKDITVFASGVSNSSTNEAKNFEREIALLNDCIKNNPNNLLVYFSTCSIYDSSLQSSAYVQHKLNVEALIQKEVIRYLIFRVSNPVGATGNPHTLLNYLVNHITQQRPFHAWEYASRNIIDIDHMFLICDTLIKTAAQPSRIINVANPVNYPVISIIEQIEQYFQTKAHYTLVSEGNSPVIDTSQIKPIFESLQLRFDKDYLFRVLKKYYPIHDV